MRTSKSISLAAFGLLVSGIAIGQTQVPNDFTAGTPARAAEVNENFDALETAVDQNASDIQSIPAGPQGDVGPQETPETEMEVTPVTDSTTPTAIPDTSIQALIDLAKEDLSTRLEVHIDEINVMQAKTVTWPDASLGCPQPGMQYKQVPEDGALIILQVEGINYEYHSGGSRGLFLCEKTYKDLSPPPKIDLFNLTPSKSDSDSTTPDNGIPPGEDQ